MERINYYIEKYKIIILILIGIIILVSILGYIYLKTNNSNNSVEIIEERIATIDEVEKQEEVIKRIKVDIKGYVKKPGVYEVDNDGRVIDIINLAGGLKEGANTEYINLSKKVKDEMIIIIYSNDEIEKFRETEKQVIYTSYECVCPDNINNACITDDDLINTNSNNIENNTSDNKISINTSSIDELKKIPGIGDSKAKAIIEYRDKNGLFKNIEDIKNVTGIGESIYTKIKDSIKL